MQAQISEEVEPIKTGVGPLGYAMCHSELAAHPEEIKAALRMKGVTLTALAEQAGVSRSMVTHVIHGHTRSANVMERIAKIVEKPVDSLWSPKPVLRRTQVQVTAARAGAAA